VDPGLEHTLISRWMKPSVGCLKLSTPSSSAWRAQARLVGGCHLGSRAALPGPSGPTLPRSPKGHR
jgi:hypothetical protein